MNGTTVIFGKNPVLYLILGVYLEMSMPVWQWLLL